MKNLKGEIQISRPSYGDGSEFIEIQITDESSRTRFVKLKMSYSDFTRAITGQSCIPITFDTSGLDVVGMVKETKDLVFPIPKYDSDWAKENCHKFADEGWIADTYFRSQKSLRGQDGNYTAHGTQYRYVKMES